MPAKLLYRDAQGRDAGVDIAADGNPLYLGRGMDAAIRTDDAMVSRKNCKVYFAGGRHIVEDLGSPNGTFVNERRIQKQQLTHADVIRCGTLQVRYVEVAQSAASPVAARKPEPRPHTQEIDVGQVEVAEASTSSAEVELLTADLAAAKKKADDLAAEVDSLRGRTETADNELKRLRTDAVASREDLNKIRREASQDKEELVALNRLSEEMRAEVSTLRDENAALKTRVEEFTDDLATRDRQLERAQEDVQRTKGGMEELRSKLGDLQKTKDEGWRELNSQLSQVEHLREVIAEHEHMLEERRVGLISLESAAKDLRAEKEKLLRENVDLKNQLGQVRDLLSRSEAKNEGYEEEHRRLVRAMNEGSSGATDEAGRIAGELRELKVQFKKLEGDKTRLAEQLERAETDRVKLADERARVDVERAQSVEDKKTAEAARTRAEEARARAESLKQRLEEEKQAAAAARDAALASSDELRRTLDRAERRVAELEKSAASAAAVGGGDAADSKLLEAARDEAVVARTHAETHARQLDEELARVRADAEKRLAELRAEMDEKLAAMAAASGPSTLATGNFDVQALLKGGDAAAGGGDATAVGASAAVLGLRARAQEVYEGINEALSALRTTIITAKGLFGEVGPMVSDEDARRALGDALVDSMERTEDAKGLLRSLRELAQG